MYFNLPGFYNGIQVFLFKADKVYEGIALGKQAKADFLLAVGGGSVIDTAKAIAYGLAEPEKDVWELFTNSRTAKKCLPVASILTIAAAGSETSKGCVITNTQTGEKRAYNDNLARPLFAVMNPNYTKTLPDYQTASGCVDIMMHTMERYFKWRKHGNNRFDSRRAAAHGDEKRSDFA